VMGLKGDSQRFLESMASLQANLCPASLSLHLSRIDTANRHSHSSLYDADRTYFRTTKQRAYIREARCGEFDNTPSSGIASENYPSLVLQSIGKPNAILARLWKRVPRLWVLVADLGNGTHQVVTIYRGDPLWKVTDREGLDIADIRSDVELSAALEKVQACEGVDQAAWVTFMELYWNASVFDAAVPADADRRIH